MFNNADDARQELHVAVGIIDSYIQCLNRKDATILRLIKELDEAREANELLRKQVFPEEPEGAEEI